MQDNFILHKINDQEIHNYLFSLLENSENVHHFSQCCYEILSQYVEVKNFVVFNNYEDDYENIKVVYSNSINTDIKQYLSIVNNINQFQKTSINSHILWKRQDNKVNNLDYCNEVNGKQINFLYKITLNFKSKILGNLLIEIDSFNLQKNYQDYIIHLLSNYLSIYLYQQSLEIKEKEVEKEAKKLLESKENQSKYLSHMNHELRTPIAAVIGFAKMLQQQLYGELNPKQAQYVDAIHQSGKYLLDLVSDLLDISKIEAKKEDLFLEKILVNELCESSLALIKTKAQEQGLELKLKINSEVEYCYVDQRRIKQVLVNLLSNAVKFTENGSITLDVKKENNYLNFSVIDTGIGIKKEYQQKLFKAFSQLNTPLHRKHRGTGLGLVISRELARLHGGDITLISVENQGSCFTLSLPLEA
ncbi:HAMP domain-containing sensor histidine kinase [Geminocystis sp. GBBB08]|uniref:sensor histidine kinase n=1 Tax=Geminocystis sp. GBBB08 TaxID=2604140 RepID=UPI0027E2DD9D|nr:HAMP domain-containing sensor histidine kinase [Geminocystis sp. GBBB08]MBL1211298.1 HAMP domain-containing histidine kinase [Geminocystis sp. GBBB08]